MARKRKQPKQEPEGRFLPGEKDPTARTVGSDPFLLRELATMSPNGVIVGSTEDHDIRITEDEVAISGWDYDDEDGGRPIPAYRSWLRLKRAEGKNRLLLAYLVIPEYRPEDGEWLSLLDAIARAAK